MNILLFLQTLYRNRYVIGVITVLFFLLSCYTYYLYTSKKIESLQTQNENLSRQVEEQERRIEELTKNYEEVIKAKEQLSKEIDTIKEDLRKEEEKIYREMDNKKSLEELAQKKSKLVENAINRATQNVFDCFEIISRGGDC